jgi:acyl transferase domain-containing protein
VLAADADAEASAVVVPLSAKSPEALRALAEAYERVLSRPAAEGEPG